MKEESDTSEPQAYLNLRRPMRRSHKKSRKGCLECKRRHVKCDETRPRCINCATVERECQYATPWTSPDRSLSGSPGPSAPFLNPSPAAGPEDEPHANIDMVHMELFHHYLTISDKQDGIFLLDDGGMRDLITTNALRYPYLMHALLAVSAHHIGFLRPAQRSFYHDLSIRLQTRALSLFNNTVDVNQIGDSAEKRVPIFLFSSVLGFHALCDLLSHRDPDWPTAFQRFTTYMRLHRGIHNVMEGHWDNLRKTELGLIFDVLVAQWFQVKPEGHQCDDLRQKIATSPDLAPDEREGMEKAIDFLQWVFDTKPSPKSRAYALCSFTTWIARPVVRLLQAGKPEAVALLAYWFLALDRCRETWMMRDAGQHFLTLLAEHWRGTPWFEWVEVPFRMLGGDLGEVTQAAESSVPPDP